MGVIFNFGGHSFQNSIGFTAIFYDVIISLECHHRLSILKVGFDAVLVWSDYNTNIHFIIDLEGVIAVFMILILAETFFQLKIIYHLIEIDFTIFTYLLNLIIDGSL